MTLYDDKKIQSLVKKLTKMPKPKAEPGKTYDKTAPREAPTRTRSSATSSSRR